MILHSHENRKSAPQNKKNMHWKYKIVNWMNKIRKNKDMFQVSCQNIENFSRNSYFQVGGLHVRVLILVCTPIINGTDIAPDFHWSQWR